MSDSASTRTKTGTESATTESTDIPLIADRWSHNISYRQLVMSSCIGVFQLWWHPYLHDLKRLLPFIFLYNVLSAFLGFPMFYLELAIGVVTKKGVLGAWDLTPAARGVGCSMLLTCAFSAFALSVVSAWMLAFFVHSAHSFLPWLHCAASAQPACAARHRPLTAESETPAQSFFVNFVVHLKRDDLEAGMGKVIWELAIYYIISWTLIYLVAIKRIYSYSKLVLFKDVLTYFMLVCCVIGCTRLEGAGRMFREGDWNVLFEGTKIWREAMEYALLEMVISQGTLVMLGSYCPQSKVKLASTALLSFIASKTCCMASALTLGATHGALMTDYDTNGTGIWGGGPSASVILWADYVARVPGSQFWSALVFFTMFVLSISSVALMIQTIMSTFTGRFVRKITWAFLVVTCFLFCMIGTITLCTQGGLYIMSFLMDWPVTHPRMIIAAAMAFAITFTYGQTTFCEDVYFAVGEYPCVFLRICWAVTPFVMTLAFMFGLAEQALANSAAGRAVVTLILMPILLVFFVYLMFKFRVRNIVRSEK